jgi:hypothetical protein
MEIANLARQANDTDRPGFYLDATHHGNEILATEAAMRLVHKLVDEYGTNETVTYWVDNFNIYVNPVVNPDGNVRNQRHNVNSVDLNRNYPFEWCVRASSCGSGPASEPETQANVEFMMAHDLDAYASLHTGTWDYVSPRCDKEVSRERAKTDDEELYEYAYAELLEHSGMGTRGASGTGESICWAYDVLEVWSILPEVSTEQFAPAGQKVQPTPEQTEQMEGAMLGIYWLLNQTGRYGAVLEPTLVYNSTASSGVSVRLTNMGLQTATNWTFELDNPEKTVAPLLRGNQRIAPGESLNVAVPAQFMGGTIVAQLSYEHLNVNPLVSDAERGQPRDPFTRWANFTQDEVEQVLSQGQPPEDDPSTPGVAPMFAVAVLVVAALGLRRRA